MYFLSSDMFFLPNTVDISLHNSCNSLSTSQGLSYRYCNNTVVLLLEYRKDN